MMAIVTPKILHLFKIDENDLFRYLCEHLI
jgi:hypothetical protein